MMAKGNRHEILKTVLNLYWAARLPPDLLFTTETTFRLSVDTFLEPDFVFYPKAVGIPGLSAETARLVVELADFEPELRSRPQGRPLCRLRHRRTVGDRRRQTHDPHPPSARPCRLRRHRRSRRRPGACAGRESRRLRSRSPISNGIEARRRQRQAVVEPGRRGGVVPGFAPIVAYDLHAKPAHAPPPMRNSRSPQRPRRRPVGSRRRRPARQLRGGLRPRRRHRHARSGAARRWRRRLPRRRVADHDTVVIGGGDGSVSAAVDALAPTGKTLGVLPCGTLNLLARDLGMPDDVDAAIAALARATPRRIDLASLNGRLFHSLSGLGFFSQMARAARGGARPAAQDSARRRGGAAGVVAHRPLLPRHRGRRPPPGRSTPMRCWSPAIASPQTDWRRQALDGGVLEIHVATRRRRARRGSRPAPISSPANGATATASRALPPNASPSRPRAGAPGWRRTASWRARQCRSPTRSGRARSRCWRHRRADAPSDPPLIRAHCEAGCHFPVGAASRPRAARHGLRRWGLS